MASVPFLIEMFKDFCICHFWEGIIEWCFVGLIAMDDKLVRLFEGFSMLIHWPRLEEYLFVEIFKDFCGCA